MTLALWSAVSASGPLEDTPPNQDNGRRVSLASTGAKCLAVEAGLFPDSISATVHLRWEGQIDRATLVLAAAGSRGGHSLYVNDQRVGGAPVEPSDHLFCQPGSPPPALASGVEIPVPVEVLRQGDNVIALTNDADPGDGWTVIHAKLRIYGLLSSPPVETVPTVAARKVGATGPPSGTLTLPGSYIDNQPHVIWWQEPQTYAVPAPLLVAIHGMGGDGEGALNALGPSADGRGWLLVAPTMHNKVIDVNEGTHAIAWVGAQHDIIAAVEYMIDNYDVDKSRIYAVGQSMGGQTALMMRSKYPDVFAAAAEWMGYTDLGIWQQELYELGQGEGQGRWPERNAQRVITETTSTAPDDPGDPPTDPDPAVQFEYHRRSPIKMAANGRLVPLQMWHGVRDIAVISTSHPIPMQTEVNSSDPITAAVLNLVDKCKNPNPPPLSDPTRNFGHCYSPFHFPLLPDYPEADGEEVLDFLYGYTLSSQPPLSLTILTDESKPYYWLNLVQTGGDHWSQVTATCDMTKTTVTAVVSDTRPLTVACNLGSTPIGGSVVEQPGLGLPDTTYLVEGGGNYRLETYTSGYLTAALTTTGRTTLTISAIAVEVSVDPAMVWGARPATSTVTVLVQDQMSRPVPDATTVKLTASEGAFPNESSTYVTATAEGRTTAVLSLGPTEDDVVEIVASAESVTGSMSIDVIHPHIELLVSPSAMTVHSGQVVTYTYRLTNTGDITLTEVTVIDDGVTVCDNVILAAEATQNCARSAKLSRTTTTTATVTGRDPLGHVATDSYLTTVNVIGTEVYLPVVVRNSDP